MNEFHEDMIAHDKTVANQHRKENLNQSKEHQYELWEDVLFKFSTEVMSRKERHIINDLMSKYDIKEKS
jgi:hypothetical protein